MMMSASDSTTAQKDLSQKKAWQTPHCSRKSWKTPQVVSLAFGETSGITTSVVPETKGSNGS